jgi:UDP-2,3-diacylglucosamine pyrophosphatase LpxH
VAREAQRRGVDGVMCGHIHHAEMRRIGDILYLNDGDWVESCSALVEDAHGHLEILRWSQSAPQSDPAPAATGVQAAPLPA